VDNKIDSFDDLRFLMSRSLDGDLSADESARLENALANSAELRSDRAEFVAVHRLVTEWGSNPVEIDWAAHHDLIKARIGRDAKCERDDRRVGELLSDWAGRQGVSNVDLRGRVLAEIHGTHRATRPMRWVIRLGLPLAAAAAIAIAVLLPNWKSGNATNPISIVQIGPGSGPVATAASTTVVFERTATSRIIIQSGGSMEIIVAGSTPAAPIVEESAPL